VFADWRKSTMTKADAKIAALKADKHRDATDDQVLRDVTKTADEAKLFQLTIANAWLGVEVALGELVIVTDDAYKRYPHEADAYAAQHAVQKEFAAGAAAPPGKP
jgi:hypothetical protein